MYGPHHESFMEYVDGIIDRIAAANPIQQPESKNGEEREEAHDETPKTIDELKSTIREIYRTEYRAWATELLKGVHCRLGDYKVNHEKHIIECKLTCGATLENQTTLFHLQARSLLLFDENGDLFEKDAPEEPEEETDGLFDQEQGESGETENQNQSTEEGPP